MSKKRLQPIDTAHNINQNLGNHHENFRTFQMLLLILEALLGETDFPLFFTRRFDNIFSYFDALHDRRQETVHRFDQQIDQ